MAFKVTFTQLTVKRKQAKIFWKIVQIKMFLHRANNDYCFLKKNISQWKSNFFRLENPDNVLNGRQTHKGRKEHSFLVHNQILS